ncbi:MAG: CvpA family protein [Clostridia bacterium]|nr:CvpA family protein [Clostridia bacterium]
MEILPLVIDAILILIFVATILDGRRKGFFKTVLSLVATAVSILIAYEYSAPLAEWANEAFIQKAAVNTFAEAISVHLSSGTQAIIDAIPDYIAKAAEAGGVTVSAVVADISSSVDAVKAAEQIYGGIYGILVFPILSVIAFIIIYAISNAVLSFGISFVNNIFKLPVLKSLNKFFGGVIGAVKGIVVIAILSVVLVVVSPIFPDVLGQAVNSSNIPQFFADIILK